MIAPPPQQQQQQIQQQDPYQPPLQQLPQHQLQQQSHQQQQPLQQQPFNQQQIGQSQQSHQFQPDMRREPDMSGHHSQQQYPQQTQQQQQKQQQNYSQEEYQRYQSSNQMRNQYNAQSDVYQSYPSTAMPSVTTTSTTMTMSGVRDMRGHDIGSPSHRTGVGIAPIPRTVPLHTVTQQLASSSATTSSHPSSITSSPKHKTIQSQPHGQHSQQSYAQQLQPKKTPPQVPECWSPPTDLSPILDVSPSIEAAEQEIMEKIKSSGQSVSNYFLFLLISKFKQIECLWNSCLQLCQTFRAPPVEPLLE